MHAALLIDFDNVTMGMRSDLSKELKTLLDSDVIKGKVSVQRAYADWRRYPQYIVPLSEASVDLIFAPAYGSNKKNATDIRMAIDALELVFTRPEIGTFILLTGDSDFSSLVLKLKEYGKYVIGVGIQESSSDILVQNCDEYYSYTSLTGLTKTTELTSRARDPWVLVKDAVGKMVSRGDVMRSDRLKQVMQEIDSNFDERSIGFSKFSRFLAEASSRGLVHLHKVGNGQYEVGPATGGTGRSSQSDQPRPRRDRERGRGGRRGRREAPSTEAATPREPTAESGADAGSDDPLREAYRFLADALERLRSAGREPVRDSDVKRKILELRPRFDEAELGFPKFSRFLAQAEEHGIVRLRRGETGNVDVSLADAGSGPSVEEAGGPFAEAAPGPEPEPEPEPGTQQEPEREPHATAAAPDEPAGEGGGPTVIDLLPPETSESGLGLGPRRGSTRRRGSDDEPPLFEGQIAVTTQSETSEPHGAQKPGRGDTDVSGLGLPSDPEAIVRYLTHRYRGVGEKTAETLVERFGSSLFATLHNDPAAVAQVVPANRADQVLEAWRADYERRTGAKGGPAGGNGGEANGGRRRGRGRGRGRSRD